MQQKQLLASLIENPNMRKQYFDGYRLIIKDAMDNKLYEAAAEHKKIFKWLETEINLLADDLEDAA